MPVLRGNRPRCGGGDGSPADDLHELRKRGKELRYLLEFFGGSYPRAVVKPMVSTLKDLQDVLGEIHDCDVHLPETAAFLAELVGADVAAVAAGRPAPNRAAYAGLVALEVELRARRERCFAAFLAQWADLERKGFRARLEYAVTERAGDAIIGRES